MESKTRLWIHHTFKLAYLYFGLLRDGKRGGQRSRSQAQRLRTKRLEINRRTHYMVLVRLVKLLVVLEVSP